ncbi:uncharacterized protein si:ch211-276i12.4 isoform X2 [Danio rerio]|uniref:Si:ch211-276i12.4 n=1 Tax=Danio rerio TaxID=7955 RepID=A0A0R4IQW1_DANRE|nr:clock-controlled protein 8-like [Danio rerio]|eukprot:XP_017214552.1 clock-controlled protein 8-like [Danio rerio]
MERYFTPVRGSSEDEVKVYKHFHQHHNHQHHPNHYQHHGSHSHSSSSSHGKHRHPDPHRHDNQHPSHHQRQRKVPVDQHNFSKRSSSSLSSSSSSSTPSWTSEPSLDEETYLTPKPKHSLSCSNIPEVQKISHDRDSEDFDYDYRAQKHRGSLENTSKQDHRMPKLSRGHSKSEEGLQQSKPGSQTIDHGPLYKTTSLGQNLAFQSNSPKKAVSSIQLPSKGILKNKDEGQNRGEFRKAKSMEVLSTRVDVKATSKQISMEAARENFVKGKLQFSAFLDEITKQVISPCALSSYGVTPPKKQESVTLKQHPERPDSGKTATDSSSHSRPQKRASKHHQHLQNRTLSPPPSPRRSSKSERQGVSSGKHHRQYSQMLTDGTSTSPETIHHHKERHQSSHGSSRHFHAKQMKGSPPLPPSRNPEYESQSSKSSTSASSEKSDGPKHTGHRRQSRPHRDSACSADRVQLLEEYNKELHENLLQMVACIENMETELQCTKMELISLKEKYKRLQESYSVSQQANGVLEQKLKSSVDSLGSERTVLTQRIVDLTKQLDSAQKTIGSLENINIPSLIRELLKNHLDSQEALEQFICPRTSTGQPDSNQASAAKGEAFQWPQSCSGFRQQPATAFQPWKHEQDPWAGLEEFTVKGSDSQLPFSFAEDVPIHKTMAETKSQSHQVHQLAVNTEIHVFPPNPYNVEELRQSRQTGGEERNPADVSYFTAQRLLNEFLKQIPPPADDEGGEKDIFETRKLADGKQ